MSKVKRVYAKRSINLRVEGSDPPDMPSGFVRSECCNPDWCFRSVLSVKFQLHFRRDDNVVIKPGEEEANEGEMWEAQLTDKLRSVINLRKFGAPLIYTIQVVDQRTAEEKRRSNLKPPPAVRARSFRLPKT